MITAWIKDIFIPKRIGTYTLVPQRIISFDIGKSIVYATQILQAGNTVTIEKCLEEPLEQNTTLSYAERITNAIKKILAKADKYDIIRTALPSSVIMFKDMQLPFTEREKIVKVLPYELEPFLPFPIQEAIIDFIVVQITSEPKQSNIIAVAVKKEYIAEHVAYFAQAGVHPDTITIDMFDLYGLSQKIPAYQQSNYALIDIGFTTTHLAYIQQGRLCAVRTIQKGMHYLAKSISQEMGISMSEALNDIIRFGLEHHENNVYTITLHNSLANFLNDIQFTLDAFTTKCNAQHASYTLLILGKGAEINQLSSYITQQLNISCFLFDANALLSDSEINSKLKGRIPLTHIISLSTAIGSPIMQNFNLAQQEFKPATTSLLYKQIGAGIILIILMITALIVHTIWQTRKLSYAVRTAEQEVLDYLRNKNLISETKNLNTAANEATEMIDNAEHVWFPFSQQQRFSFLTYLQKLSSAIDKESIGLKLQKLEMTADKIILVGELKDVSATTPFEQELKKTGLFEIVPSLQKKEFNFELKFKKSKEGT